MPYATNPIDGTRIYVEDNGGPGDPVVFYGGILDTVEVVRNSPIARALPQEEFRLIYADHRGLGRSDKPRAPEAYGMALRVGDAVAVLDALGMERAHFVGTSYGGRLCFGIGELAPERVWSLVVGGQQPHALNSEAPLARVVISSLAASREAGTIKPFVEALESFSGSRLPESVRAAYLRNDPVAVEAASTAMVAEGDLSEDLTAWRTPCLIFLGARDVDFWDQARRAAEEIPDARFVTLQDSDHLGAHFEQETVIPEVLSFLRQKGPRPPSLDSGR